MLEPLHQTFVSRPLESNHSIPANLENVVVSLLHQYDLHKKIQNQKFHFHSKYLAGGHGINGCKHLEQLMMEYLDM